MPREPLGEPRRSVESDETPRYFEHIKLPALDEDSRLLFFDRHAGQPLLVWIDGEAWQLAAQVELFPKDVKLRYGLTLKNSKGQGVLEVELSVAKQCEGEAWLAHDILMLGEGRELPELALARLYEKLLVFYQRAADYTQKSIRHQGLKFLGNKPDEQRVRVALVPVLQKLGYDDVTGVWTKDYLPDLSKRRQ